MCKKIALLFILSIWHFEVFAQTDTVYLDDFMYETEQKENQVYYRIEERKGDVVLEKIGYTASNKLYTVKTYEDKKLQGVALEYYSSGKLKNKTRYENGNIIASDSTFYDNEENSPYYINYYNLPNKKSSLLVLYPNGEIKRRETYKDGEVLSSECYKENGDIEEYYTFEVEPDFPGGDDGFIQFLGENLRYPSEALKNNIQGKVRLRLLLNAEGKILSISVLNDVNPLLAAEAVRIMRLSPNFIPAQLDGVNIPSYTVMPIAFVLSDE